MRASPSSGIRRASSAPDPSVDPSSMKMNSRAKSPRWALSPAITCGRKGRLLKTGMTKLTPGFWLLSTIARAQRSVLVALHHDVAGEFLDAGEVDEKGSALLFRIGLALGLG